MFVQAPEALANRRATEQAYRLLTTWQPLDPSSDTLVLTSRALRDPALQWSACWDAVGKMIRRLEIDHGKGMMLDRKMTSITDLLGCFFPSVDRIVKSVRATLVGRILRL